MGTDGWASIDSRSETQFLERYGTCEALHGDSIINTMGRSNSTGFGVNEKQQMEIVPGPCSHLRTDKRQPQPNDLSFHLYCFMLLKELYKI